MAMKYPTVALGQIINHLNKSWSTPQLSKRFYSLSNMNQNEIQKLPAFPINSSELKKTVLSTKYIPFLKLYNRLPFQRNKEASSSQGARPFSTSNHSSCGSCQARHHYHAECEAGINKQIYMEFYSSYVYLSMAYFFDRADVASPGFYNFFKKWSENEREHAKMYMSYQNKRGGKIVLEPINKPPKDDWSSPEECIKFAIGLTKQHYDGLLKLHKCASAHGDPQLCDFIESVGLTEQVEHLKVLTELATKLQRVGSGLGQHILDGELNK